MARSEFWKQRRVLVTGCTGILGSWLTLALLDAGAEVVGLIRDRVPLSNLNLTGADRRIIAVDGDIGDGALIERVLNEYEIEVVFHLAAQPLVRLANRAPVGTFEINVRGTWLLLDACRISPTVKRIVVASSDKAYGAYPIRLNGFVAKDRAMLDQVLAGAEWRQLEYTLKRFVTGFKRKIVPYRDGFQL